MAAKYTYQDFETTAKNAGIDLSGWSKADLSLAQSDPDAGMSLLKYARDWNEAQTDDQRALAESGAEAVRSAYGGYTGAGDGEVSVNAGYASPYARQTKTTAEDLNGSFGYDAATDPAWRSYEKTYAREGQRAYQNSLGSAAANTGGMASTAAVAAAQQAQNYYGAQAADKQAELRQQAYENYLSGQANTRSNLSALTELDQNGRDQYDQDVQNALDKWQTYGYVTADIAGTLGLPAGTPDSEQAYKEWSESYQEMLNGVDTSLTGAERVERGSMRESASRDSAANYGTLQFGSGGSTVILLQKYLLSLGYANGNTGADGRYGYNTTAMVKQFQRDHGLSVTGVCDRETWARVIEAAAG